MNFLQKIFPSYPTGNDVDYRVLYAGLGSFWNQMFQEQGTVKGYTIGMCNELIQAYYNLVETINSYSVKDCPLLHTELWYPIVIRKSQFNQAPFVFKPNDAVFGSQPSTDEFYRGMTFRFGYPKSPSPNVYSYTPPSGFTDFSIITNRILSPSKILIKGADVVVQDGVLYFNQNIFDSSYITLTNLIDDTGNPVTYVDQAGQTQNDQSAILWAYSAALDTNLLAGNFGVLFNLNLASTEATRSILKSIFDLSIQGPTVSSIKSIISSFMGISPIIENQETVEDIFTDAGIQFVITDKHVYQFPTRFTLLPSVIPNAVFNTGDILVDAVEYADNVYFANWWISKIQSKVALSQYIFLGGYQQQLVVSNEPALLTVGFDGTINFPIEGIPSDVAIFQAYINEPVNKAAIFSALGISAGSVLAINPLDFLMQNFMANSTALIKFNFTEDADSMNFLSYMQIVKDYLPKHVYFIFLLNFSLNSEVYDQLNNNLQVQYPLGVRTICCDGTDSAGFIDSTLPSSAVADPSDFVSFFKDKLFSIGRGPNLPMVGVSSNTDTSVDVFVQDGSLLIPIPAGTTTRQTSRVSLMAFS